MHQLLHQPPILQIIPAGRLLRGAGNRELQLTHARCLAQRPQLLPGRRHATDVVARLGGQEIIQADAVANAASMEPARREATSRDPVADSGNGDSGAPRGLGDSQQLRRGSGDGIDGDLRLGTGGIGWSILSHVELIGCAHQRYSIH
jgi:hypothetical protein